MTRRVSDLPKFFDSPCWLIQVSYCAGLANRLLVPAGEPKSKRTYVAENPHCSFMVPTKSFLPALLFTGSP